MIQRISKRELFARTLHQSGAGRVCQLAGSWRGTLVLNYHRIGDGRHSQFDRNLWSATAEEFDHQVRTVTRDFDVIGLEDLDHALSRRGGRHVLITFDDGYLDNYTDAFPILKTYHAKALFFVTTGFLDVPQVPWWDEVAWMVRNSPLKRLAANPWTTEPVEFDDPNRDQAIVNILRVYKRLDGSETHAYINWLADALQTGRCPSYIAHELWMTWSMIREMQQAGMAIGGHTVNHPILSSLTAEQQDFEVRECQRRLTQELGQPVTSFSYPVGGPTSFNQDTRTALEKHGFRWGFTYIGGHVKTPARDRYAIPRAAIETDINEPLFHAILTWPQWFA
jgi:peptidoglycan/xylan/chitin deacetylase (PgdA/CDA1 family)